MKLKIYTLLYLFICIFITSYTYNFPPITGIDDANIYFTYMKNFSHGQGFVYNIGGERVEGFTSLLWTLIGSFIFKFTNNIEIVLFIINIILIYYSLLISGRIIISFFRDDKNKSAYIVMFYGMLLIFPGFYEWTIFSLLETALWTFEITLFSYLLVIPYLNNNFSFKKSSAYIALLLPVFIITRPESMLIGLIFVFIRLIQLVFEEDENKKKSILKNITPIATVYIVIIYILIKWRTYYFGYPFPNTYYVKMSDGFYNNLIEGYIYLKEYTIYINPSVLILYLTLLIWSINILIQKKYSIIFKIITVFCLLSISGLIIPFYTGGDHFAQFRFYQPYSMIFYSTIIFGTSLFMKRYNRVFKKSNLNPKSTTIILLLLLSILPLRNRYSLLLGYNLGLTIFHELECGKSSREFGTRLNTFFKEPRPSIGVLPAGISYSYNGEVIDVLGLNNSQVAHDFSERPKPAWKIPKSHRAFSKKIFLKQKPELFYIDFVNDTSTYVSFIKNDKYNFVSKVTKYPEFKS